MCVLVSSEGMSDEKCVVRLLASLRLATPSGPTHTTHTQIQEVTVHVFAMADRKRFKEWGKGLRKTRIKKKQACNLAHH